MIGVFALENVFIAIVFDAAWGGVGGTGEQLFAQLVLTTGILLLWPWDPPWVSRTARDRWEPSYQEGQKHLCQQAGQLGENFKLEATEERNDDPQSSEEGVDWVQKQRVQGFADWSELVMDEHRAPDKMQIFKKEAYNGRKLSGDSQRLRRHCPSMTWWG